MVKFASLTKPELYEFVFDLYDADRSGSLDEREFATMSQELQSKDFSFPKNVQAMLKMLEVKETMGTRSVHVDGLVDLPDFLKFARHFPVAFFPIINFQRHVREATLGDNYWGRVVARKMRVKEMVSHMRRNYGAQPESTWQERVACCFDKDAFFIRKRAAELYEEEVNQRIVMEPPNAAASD